MLIAVFASVRVVKAFGRERHEDELFRRKSRQRMTEQVRLASIQASFHVLIGFSIAVGTAAALVIGVAQVQARAITVGDTPASRAAHTAASTFSTLCSPLSGIFASGMTVSIAAPCAAR